MLIYVTFTVSFLKNIFVQIKLFKNFSSKGSIMTHKNSTQVINLQRKWGFLNFPLFPSFRILPSPPHFHCFLLNKSLFRCNFLDFILITSLDSCKEHPSHLFATEMRFCKFSIVSFFSNWFYSSERKPGGAGNFQIFEKKTYFLFQVPKDFIYICK